MPDSFTVFIVDDDAGLRKSLHFLLDTVGIHSECHSSAAEFLDSYSGQPGCLIVDCFMPGMDGMQLQARLAETSNLPIIFISGHADQALADAAVEAGALAFLKKPMDPQDLIDRLERLRRSASARAAENSPEE